MGTLALLGKACITVRVTVRGNSRVIHALRFSPQCPGLSLQRLCIVHALTFGFKHAKPCQHSPNTYHVALARSLQLHLLVATCAPIQAAGKKPGTAGSSGTSTHNLAAGTQLVSHQLPYLWLAALFQDVAEKPKGQL